MGSCAHTSTPRASGRRDHPVRRFERRDVGDESDGWSWLSRDSFRVGLGECAASTPASALGDHSYFAYVTVQDIDGLYAELTARGVPIMAPPATKPWGMREFAVRTPDGHRMTFGSEGGAAT